jgi:predicted nuclease of predicted toxin-antitoxin system
MELALREARILITEDKDFGELVFVLGLPHGPIVRVVELTVDEQVQAIGELISQYASELGQPTIVTVTHNRVRIRHTS